MKRLFNKTWWGVPALAVVAAVVTIIVAGGAILASSWPTRTVTGTGTITVNQPAPPPSTTPSTYSFEVSPSTLDFSGAVSANSTYTESLPVTISNDSVQGSDGADLTLSGVTATATGLPTGWTLSGSYSGSLAPGQSDNMTVTLTSPALTSTVTLPNFTISLAGS